MNEINMRINDYLQALSKSNKFSGSVLASLGFEEIFAQGFGMANVELSVKNTKYSKFRIASITKSFTAIAVLQLVEKGVIHLEDSLDKYFPSQYGADRIHISNLLNHTSGIVNYFEDSDLMKWMGTRSTQAELINKFNSRPLEFEPGQEYKYSNSGYVLLGALIEKVTGQPYHAYFQEHIFKPAGMYDTSVEEPSQILKERASGYQLDENGRLQNAPYVHMSNAHAAGAIISTVGDLYKWDQALNSNILLKGSTKVRMWTPSIETTGFSYGYGWMVQDTPFGKLVGHSGGIHGFNSIFLKYVDAEVTVIILSNISLPVDTIGREIAAIICS